MKIQIQHYDVDMEANLPDDVTFSDLIITLEGMLTGIGYHRDSLNDYLESQK